MVAPLAGAWVEIVMTGDNDFAKKSLPSRERGLKWYTNRDGHAEVKSLPSRERGLKLTSDDRQILDAESLPSRERGLK